MLPWFQWSSIIGILLWFLKVCSSYFVFHIWYEYVVNDKEKIFLSMIRKDLIFWQINIFSSVCFHIRRKDNFNLKRRLVLPVFPVNVSYKVIGLSSAIWWLFRVDENSVIITERTEKTKMRRKLLMNYCSEIILIDPNIFQTFFSNLMPYV